MAVDKNLDASDATLELIVESCEKGDTNAILMNGFLGIIYELKALRESLVGADGINQLQ